MLRIEKTTENNCLTYTLSGRLDTLTAPELELDLNGALDGVTELIFDLIDLDYLSSAGLRVLLGAHKALSGKGGLKVTHVSELVNEVFEVTGFSDILTIE